MLNEVKRLCKNDFADLENPKMKEPCEKWIFDDSLFNDTDAWFVQKGEENND